MRLRNKCTILIVFVSVGFFVLVLFNEFLIYYFTLSLCKWPNDIKTVDGYEPINAMILADIHMLGPYRGHWADKLRREWQMHRAYQTALTLFAPEAVFILGDLFDEGQWVNRQQFKDYVARFNRLFYSAPSTSIYGVVGNHDVGFHYKMHPILVDRFNIIFNNTDNSLVTIRGVHFVLINSMSMEQDGCDLCVEAKISLEKISKQLKCANPMENMNNCKNVPKLQKYSQPILMQHFPTYRKSDKNCIEHDDSEPETYRPNWEVLSIKSTDLIGELLDPRVVFGGHSHNYCKIKNRLKVEEYTVPSFNWRNKNNPKMLLAKFSPIDYSVEVCSLPLESTVMRVYVVGVLLTFFLYLFRKKIFYNRI